MTFQNVLEINVILQKQFTRDCFLFLAIVNDLKPFSNLL